MEVRVLSPALKIRSLYGEINVDYISVVGVFFVFTTIEFSQPHTTFDLIDIIRRRSSGLLSRDTRVALILDDSMVVGIQSPLLRKHP